MLSFQTSWVMVRLSPPSTPRTSFHQPLLTWLFWRHGHHFTAWAFRGRLSWECSWSFPSEQQLTVRSFDTGLQMRMLMLEATFLRFLHSLYFPLFNQLSQKVTEFLGRAKLVHIALYDSKTLVSWVIAQHPHQRSLPKGHREMNIQRLVFSVSFLKTYLFSAASGALMQPLQTQPPFTCTVFRWWLLTWGASGSSRGSRCSFQRRKRVMTGRLH